LYGRSSILKSTWSRFTSSPSLKQISVKYPVTRGRTSTDCVAWVRAVKMS